MKKTITLSVFFLGLLVGIRGYAQEKYVRLDWQLIGSGSKSTFINYDFEGTHKTYKIIKQPQKKKSYDKPHYYGITNTNETIEYVSLKEKFTEVNILGFFIVGSNANSTKIFNLNGRLLRELINEEALAVSQMIDWRDGDKSPLVFTHHLFICAK